MHDEWLREQAENAAKPADEQAENAAKAADEQRIAAETAKQAADEASEDRKRACKAGCYDRWVPCASAAIVAANGFAGEQCTQVLERCNLDCETR
jgi:hypothetical protein